MVCDCKFCLYRPEAERVVDALDKIFGIEIVFASEESTIGDCSPEDDDLPALEAYLGVPVAKSDYIWEVAKRLREK